MKDFVSYFFKLFEQKVHLLNLKEPIFILSDIECGNKVRPFSKE